jgi:hypothetical protein
MLAYGGRIGKQAVQRHHRRGRREKSEQCIERHTRRDQQNTVVLHVVINAPDNVLPALCRYLSRLVCSAPAPRVRCRLLQRQRGTTGRFLLAGAEEGSADADQGRHDDEVAGDRTSRLGAGFLGQKPAALPTTYKTWGRQLHTPRLPSLARTARSGAMVGLLPARWRENEKQLSSSLMMRLWPLVQTHAAWLLAGLAVTAGTSGQLGVIRPLVASSCERANSPNQCLRVERLGQAGCSQQRPGKAGLAVSRNDDKRDL